MYGWPESEALVNSHGSRSTHRPPPSSPITHPPRERMHTHTHTHTCTSNQTHLPPTCFAAIPSDSARTSARTRSTVSSPPPAAATMPASTASMAPAVRGWWRWGKGCEMRLAVAARPKIRHSRFGDWIEECAVDSIDLGAEAGQRLSFRADNRLCAGTDSAAANKSNVSYTVTRDRDPERPKKLGETEADERRETKTAPRPAPRAPRPRGPADDGRSRRGNEVLISSWAGQRACMHACWAAAFGGIATGNAKAQTIQSGNRSSSNISSFFFKKKHFCDATKSIRDYVRLIHIQQLHQHVPSPTTSVFSKCTKTSNKS